MNCSRKVILCSLSWFKVRRWECWLQEIVCGRPICIFDICRLSHAVVVFLLTAEMPLRWTMSSKPWTKPLREEENINHRNFVGNQRLGQVNLLFRRHLSLIGLSFLKHSWNISSVNTLKNARKNIPRRGFNVAIIAQYLTFPAKDLCQIPTALCTVIPKEWFFPSQSSESLTLWHQEFIP